MCHKPSPIYALSNGISYVIIAPAVFENTAENARSAKALLFYIYIRLGKLKERMSVFWKLLFTRVILSLYAFFRYYRKKHKFAHHGSREFTGVAESIGLYGTLSLVYINTLSGNIFQYYQKVSNITRKCNKPAIMVILQPFTWIKSENFTPHITFHPSWLSELTRRHSGWKVIFGVKFSDFIRVGL